ncbi:hypothetical protein ACM7EG_05995 [Pseudomonas aeruginosa]
MTVIASYNHFGCGIVIGDILINGPVNEGNPPETILPTLGNVKDFFGGAWGIYRPVQKVCIISDVCAISWAGRLIHARSFVERLNRLSKRISIRVEIIERLFKKYGEGEIAIAGALYESGEIQTFGFGCNEIKCPTLGTVYSGGSGASIIQDYVNIVKEMRLDRPPEDEIAARGVSLALTQVAHLLNAEFRKGYAAESIMELFGGGYEIAAFYEGKFHKINANFTFLEVSHKDGYLKVGNPRLLINQTYSQGRLKFRAISPQGAYDDRVVRDDCIEMAPFYRHLKNDSMVSPDSDTNWACFVFVDDFKFLGDKLISIILKSEIPPVYFSVIDGNLHVQYSEKASGQIEEFLMNCYNNKEH